MNLTPLRTAAIAGTCTVALAFVALPAHAATLSSFSHPASDSSTSATDTATSAADDSGSEVGDGTAISDDGPEAGDDDGTDASDDQDGDGADDPSDTPAALPVEQGTPAQAFRQTVLLPKEIRTKGIKVVYSGLTPKAHYQPYVSGGQADGPLEKAKKANGEGTITLVIHPRKSLSWMTQLGASFTVELRGIDTQLDLTQLIEVKYDSDVALTTERHGSRVALAVSVDHETKSGKDAAWKQVAVRFQKKVHGRWVTVRTVRTDASGVAKAKVTSGESEWRAVVASRGTVAGTTTRGHRR